LAKDGLSNRQRRGSARRANIRHRRPEKIMPVSRKSALLAAAVCLSLAGQALAASPAVYNGYKVPRDSSGHPDLNGSWDAASLTTLQRPPGYGGRLVMTPEEVAAIEGRSAALNAQARQKTDPNATVKDIPEDGGLNYSPGFLDPGTTVMRVHGEPRTSLLTTPDGYIPPDLRGHTLPRPQQIVRGQFDRSKGIVVDRPEAPGANDNPEGRDLAERCILGFTQALMIMPSGYNSITTIQQSPGAVAIESEMVHAVRIARLNGKHRTDGVKTWEGDSIAWYEGNTLVVETLGFDPRFPNFGPIQDNTTVKASDAVKVTERFTRVSPTRLHYAFTIDDPKTWAKPWGGEYEMNAAKATYEYACHEGNYGLEAILAGARQQEAVQSAAQKPVAAK
jgi:hypothetical protein